MEESPSTSSAAPAAAPKRGTLWAIIAVVIAVAITASVMALAVFPALQQPSYAKFTVTTLDFAYDRIDFNPEHHVKAGQIVWVVMTNTGTNDHEFLLYQDKDAALTSANAALAVALTDHPTYQTNASEKQAALDEYDTLHDAWENLTRYNDVDKDVVPDQTVNIFFMISTPGTYYFVCHQVDTTSTPWMIHQAHGMWGTIIVDP